MKKITPLVVTDALLTDTDVPETDHPAWNAATVYTAGDLVIHTTTHRRYERRVTGTTATAPESDPVNWRDIGPTNRWAMFDASVGTATTQAATITVEITPAANVTGIALLDLDVESVDIEVTVGADVVYSLSVAPVLLDTATTWFDYFFTSILTRDTIVLTDLPPYPDAVITITLANGSSDVQCGSCIFGEVFDIGDTQYGAGIGIIDYSKKSTDEFGVTTIVERSYAKRLTARAAVPSGAVDEVARRLAGVRAKPVVWIGADGYDSTVIYGWCKDWGVDISYPTLSFCSLTIEGLT